MASALSALPSITATALGASLATGLAAGQYKAPTAVVGYVVPMDALNFYVAAQDVANIINVTATATSTQNSADLTNTVHRGATFYVSITSVGATATAGINFQVKDPGGTGYYTMQRVSIDSMTTTSQGIIQIYPGGPTSGGGAGFLTGGQINDFLPATYRVQVSLTATASGGGANATIQISQSKTM